MAPSPLSEGRIVVEFIDLSLRNQSLTGARMEVDCEVERLRLIGQADYGSAGTGQPLRLKGDDGFDYLNETNTEFRDPAWFRPYVTEACRLHRRPDRPHDFSNLDEFVAAAGRVDENYFAGKRCVVITPQISATGSE